MNRKTRVVSKVTKRILACLLAATLLASSMLAVYAEESGENLNLSDSEKVIAVAAGMGFTMALRADGTVWTWGYNYSGQLGDGTKINRNTPVQVVGLDNIKAIAAGSDYSFAVEEDGSVWAWGENSGGQLGDGSTTNRTLPVKVTGLQNVISVSAAGSHTMAIVEGGMLYFWGTNNYGLYGDGMGSRTSLTPERVYSLNQVTAIATADRNCMAIHYYKAVSSWGSNRYGYVGDPTGSREFYTPLLLDQSLLSHATSIAVNSGDKAFNMVVRDNGKLVVWGTSPIGDGSTIHSRTPVWLEQFEGVESVSVDYERLVLQQDGTLWRWGSDRDNINPTVVEGISKVKSMEAGYAHSVAVSEDGEVYTWGYNWDGALGDGGESSYRLTPYRVKIPIDNTYPEKPLKIDLEDRIQGVIKEIDESRYYSFTPVTSGTYIIQCISDLDSYGEIFDSSGVRIAYNDDGMGRGESGNLRDFYIKTELNANQKYLIRVSVDDDGIGEFVLKVSR